MEIILWSNPDHFMVEEDQLMVELTFGLTKTLETKEFARPWNTVEHPCFFPEMKPRRARFWIFSTLKLLSYQEREAGKCAAKDPEIQQNI